MRVAFLLALVACSGGDTPVTNDGTPPPNPAPNGLKDPKDAKAFTLAWSEYPSWSTFGVAHEAGIIDGREGRYGDIERKWNTDIILKEADYDSCLGLYGSGKADAAALTNMDTLPLTVGRNTVGLMPTSTSVGADALIVTDNIKNIRQLRGKDVRGLELTVSEYMFVRNLELLKENEKYYKFSNMDPGAAAVAMQQKQKGVEAIAVWNPFVLDTLAKRDDVHVLFDSSTIPGEIVDMIVMSQDALNRPGGKEFAHAVIDTFYEVSRRIEDESTGDETLVALGQKFSDLNLEQMKKVVTQTQFYKTPDDGIALFKGEKIKGVMEKVTKFEKDHEMLENGTPKVGYGPEGDDSVTFRFDPTYMETVKTSHEAAGK
jgi:ABC transporter binding protein (urea carboxylase system)